MTDKVKITRNEDITPHPSCDMSYTLRELLIAAELKRGDNIILGGTSWKVLDAKENRFLLWKQSNVTDHVFNANGSNQYEGSDIENYLKNEFRETIPQDMQMMIDGDFFLLTVDQINEYMPEPADRLAFDEEGFTTWWWTASPSAGHASSVRLVHPDGDVSNNYAHYSSGVAPACYINL